MQAITPPVHFAPIASSKWKFGKPMEPLDLWYPRKVIHEEGEAATNYFIIRELQDLEALNIKWH